MSSYWIDTENHGNIHVIRIIEGWMDEWIDGKMDG